MCSKSEKRRLENDEEMLSYADLSSNKAHNCTQHLECLMGRQRLAAFSIAFAHLPRDWSLYSGQQAGNLSVCDAASQELS
jgi:hypothetical protein